MEKMMTLREVCELVGVTRRAIQGYEKAGMLCATGKNKYGYLLYDEWAVEKIKCIKKYRDLGFSVKQTKILLEATHAEIEGLIKERLLELRKEIRALERQIKIAEKILVDCT